MVTLPYKKHLTLVKSVERLNKIVASYEANVPMLIIKTFSRTGVQTRRLNNEYEVRNIKNLDDKMDELLGYKVSKLSEITESLRDRRTQLKGLNNKLIELEKEISLADKERVKVEELVLEKPKFDLPWYVWISGFVLYNLALYLFH
jgi:predicted TIM-barrel fold metal-dependent hydrolase